MGRGAVVGGVTELSHSSTDATDGVSATPPPTPLPVIPGAPAAIPISASLSAASSLLPAGAVTPSLCMVEWCIEGEGPSVMHTHTHTHTHARARASG